LVLTQRAYYLQGKGLKSKKTSFIAYKIDGGDNWTEEFRDQRVQEDLEGVPVG
jgi:hypothetical protein